MWHDGGMHSNEFLIVTWCYSFPKSRFSDRIMFVHPANNPCSGRSTVRIQGKWWLMINGPGSARLAVGWPAVPRISRRCAVEFPGPSRHFTTLSTLPVTRLATITVVDCRLPGLRLSGRYGTFYSSSDWDGGTRGKDSNGLVISLNDDVRRWVRSVG